MKNFEFTFYNLERHFEEACKQGYKIISCLDYYENKHNLSPLTLVNRVDVDLSIKKTERLLDIFNKLSVKATFFIRLHAPEYNPFDFENYRILKKIRNSGHEIGYHSEIIDQAIIWSEDAAECLERDICVLETMLDIKIKGVASHGGGTGLNNLDFWKDRNAREFNLLYEAYDSSDDFGLFHNSRYISDSEWTQWKCYENGVLVQGDRRTPTEHFRDKPPLIHILIHPDTYFDRHIYE